MAASGPAGLGSRTIRVLIACPDERQALALARQLRPEVLLIDAASRAVDGAHVTRRLTDDLDTSRVHVLVLGTPGTSDEGFASADSAGKYLSALLYNGLGRYDEALCAAREATEDPQHAAFFKSGLVELIEAAARSGNNRLAADALGRLSETAAASGSDWALGIEARCRALLSEGEDADKRYREAIELLGRSGVRLELARAHLLYGEWLRRQRRRVDAREQLRRAHELLTESATNAFAKRARIELEATGEHVRKRTAETRDDLTPQEAQVSRLAADGATNQEIGAQLFISPNTVDYHLRKAFRKLGVKSRHQLKDALTTYAGEPGMGPPA